MLDWFTASLAAVPGAAGVEALGWLDWAKLTGAASSATATAAVVVRRRSIVITPGSKNLASSTGA